MVLDGLLGFRREVTRIGLCVEEPDRLAVLLSAIRNEFPTDSRLRTD